MQLKTHIIYITLLVTLAAWSTLRTDHITTPSSEASGSDERNYTDYNAYQVTELQHDDSRSSPMGRASDQQPKVQPVHQIVSESAAISDTPYLAQQAVEQSAMADSAQQPSRSLAENMAAYTQRISQTFDNESVDQQWAQQQETALTDIFYVEETLRDIQFNDIECRETLCQIQIDNDTDDMFRRLMDIQRVILAKGLSSTSRSYMVEDDITRDYRVFIQR